MGGKGSGKPRSRALPLKYRPDWLKRADGRFRAIKAMHERMAAIAADRGGVETLSTIERGLIERYAFAELHAIKVEQDARDGKPFDLQRWCAMTDRVVRLGQLIGVERRARELPSLAEIMREEEDQ